MTIDDIQLLKLEADWMYDRYRMYLHAGTGPAWIMDDDGGPLCAFGAAFLWDGVCEVWFNLIKKDKIKSQLRIIKAILNEQGRHYHVTRYQATVKESFCKGIKFVKALGFEFEGKLRRYLPDGSDADMYSRLL